MKTLQRAMEVIAGAGLCFWFNNINMSSGIFYTCLALVIYLPVMSQFDGDSNERK